MNYAHWLLIFFLAQSSSFFQADSQIDLELHKFRELSLDYVTKLQEVNETKKFELVEIVSFIIFNFYLFKDEERTYTYNLYLILYCCVTAP